MTRKQKIEFLERRCEWLGLKAEILSDVVHSRGTFATPTKSGSPRIGHEPVDTDLRKWCVEQATKTVSSACGNVTNEATRIYDWVTSTPPKSKP